MQRNFFTFKYLYLGKQLLNIPIIHIYLNTNININYYYY
jgi:hypothetical protein